MKEHDRNFVSRRSTWISFAVLVFGTAFSMVFLSRSLQTLGITASMVPFSLLLVWHRFPLAPPGRAADSGPMTIRLRLKRTHAILQRSVVCLDALWCVAVTLYFTQLTTLQQYGLAIVGSLVLAYTASLYVGVHLRCPRCGTNLRQVRIAEVGRWSTDTRAAEERWQRCPNCGVSFDEPHQR